MSRLLQVGDKVRVTYPSVYFGMTGVIISTNNNFQVRLDDGTITRWLDSSLELVAPAALEAE